MDKDKVKDKEVKEEFEHATQTLASIIVRDEGNARYQCVYVSRYKFDFL